MVRPALRRGMVMHQLALGLLLRGHERHHAVLHLLEELRGQEELEG